MGLHSTAEGLVGRTFCLQQLAGHIGRCPGGARAAWHYIATPPFSQPHPPATPPPPPPRPPQPPASAQQAAHHPGGLAQPGLPPSNGPQCLSELPKVSAHSDNMGCQHPPRAPSTPPAHPTRLHTCPGRSLLSGTGAAARLRLASRAAWVLATAAARTPSRAAAFMAWLLLRLWYVRWSGLNPKTLLSE